MMRTMPDDDFDSLFCCWGVGESVSLVVAVLFSFVGVLVSSFGAVAVAVTDFWGSVGVEEDVGGFHGLERMSRRNAFLSSICAFVVLETLKLPCRTESSMPSFTSEAMMDSGWISSVRFTGLAGGEP